MLYIAYFFCFEFPFVGNLKHLFRSIGYPEPEPIGNTTISFRDACEAQQQVFLDATGSTKTADWL